MYKFELRFTNIHGECGLPHVEYICYRAKFQEHQIQIRDLASHSKFPQLVSPHTFVQMIDTHQPPLFIGEIRGVEGTLFDLRKPVLIGPRLKEVPAPGFDHNFCLSLPGDAWKERPAARLTA